MDRAFVDPSTGNTTCVWQAPSLSDVTALFQQAGVEVTAVEPVEEMTAGTDGS